MAGGDSPLILLIFFSRSPTSYSTPVSERLEQAMSTRNKRSGSAGRHEQLSVPRGVSTPMIPSDRDDRRIFGGLKFSISGFFWVGKFCQVFFSLGKLDLRWLDWIFWG